MSGETAKKLWTQFITMEQKLCRICLNKDANISIFSSQDDIQYSTKIMRCVNVVISEGDGLPDSICISCAEELFICYDFVNKCEASDKVLRSSTSLLDSIVEKTEVAQLDVKVEEIKEEAPDEPAHDSDDEFLASYSFEQAKKSNNKRPNSKKSKRPYKKSLGFYEGLIKRRKQLIPVKCSVCGLMLSCKSALGSHLRTHTGEKPYTCDMCGAQFNLKGSLKRHIETRHMERERERKFTCETCGSSFYSKPDIKAHLRVHTKERPYTCTFCGRAFTQLGSLIRHKRTHTGEKPFSCSTCSKKFLDKSSLDRHMLVHTDEKKFTCSLCNKSVKTKHSLRGHMVTHTNEKYNICNYCGMTFTMKGNLKSHIKRVHSEKSGDCSICNKTFTDLETHMRKHTGEKPIVCKICDKCFINKRSLATHMSFRHQNDGKFKCTVDYCAKTFPTAVMLEFHVLKQHTKHTPYVCNHCSRGFFRLSDLSRHLRVSHMDTHKFPMKSLVSG